jgi:hypothetical protein
MAIRWGTGNNLEDQENEVLKAFVRDLLQSNEMLS